MRVYEFQLNELYLFSVTHLTEKSENQSTSEREGAKSINHDKGAISLITYNPLLSMTSSPLPRNHLTSFAADAVDRSLVIKPLDQNGEGENVS